MIIATGGCLLPLLIILNLFFGKLFFSTSQWLASEGILIVLFLLNFFISFRRILSPAHKKRSGAIDVEGKIVK